MFSQNSRERNPESSYCTLIELGEYVKRAAREGIAAHEVEMHIDREVRKMGRQAFGEYLRAAGPGDLGDTVTLEDGRVLQRLPGEHVRRLTTVFGEFRFPRCVYGERPGQKIELAPTDQKLQLPEHDTSYVLQDWNQKLGVELPFGTVDKILREVLGIKQSVDTLERDNQQMADAAKPFREAQGPPDPQAEKELLVVSEDNKGVPMVRPVDKLPAGVHRTKGQKANKKQMACLGCVYTVDRNPRTPTQLVAILFHDPLPWEQTPPKACQKRYWAELTREVAGEFVRAQDSVFEHLREEVAQRRKPGQVLVNLSDGQKSLEADRHKYLPHDRDTVDILDLLHVTPRLWEAAHLFHAEGSDEANLFVRKHLLRVLQGKARSVVEDLRQLGEQHHLEGAPAKRLKTIRGFLESNLRRMHYDKYLRAGYPIATGVIEGACRHVVKDRMERTGMRWKVPGAEAMLELRTIHINGDWQAFQNFRIDYENRRLYPHQDVLGTMEREAA